MAEQAAQAQAAQAADQYHRRKAFLLLLCARSSGLAIGEAIRQAAPAKEW
jgi:hypothetical protein